jgi:hypothetical protein
MKKLSLKDIFTESDLLQSNQELKFGILQQIPQLQKLVMTHIKTDKYDQALHALEQLEKAVHSAREQLRISIQKKSKQTPSNPANSAQSISNKEI